MEIKACALRGRSTILVVALMGLAALIFGLSLNVGQALAIDVPSPHIEDLGGKTYVVTHKADKDDGSRLYGSAKSPSKKISAAKSSNKDVADVIAYKLDDRYFLSVNIYKTGTTYISYKFGGKKHKVKYVVIDYVNPIKTLKIGKKNYAKYFSLKNMANFSAGDVRGSVVSKGFTGKLNIKLNSGWKLSKVYLLNKSMKVGGKIKASKNGAKLNKAVCLWLIVKNKKTKQSEILYLTADTKKIHDLMMM